MADPSRAAQEPAKPAARQLSAEKREAILAGSQAEFLRNGYAATTMDRVAVAAGVSKATVYSHFTDKETLFQCLTQQMVGKKVAHLFGAGETAALPGDPRQALAELAHRCLEPCESQSDFLAFFRLVVGESERFPQLARTFVGQLELHAFPQVVRLFATSGFLPEADPEVSARVFIGSMVHLILMQDLLHGREVVNVDRGRFAEGLIKLLCR
jgi:TetR/AcrR family transcriptional regulator